MLRPLLTVMSGGGVRQIVVLAGLPLLSRLYDPSAFGELAAVMAAVSMAMVVVHGRYHLAIPLARDDAEARALLHLACLASIVLALPVTASTLALFGDGGEGTVTLQTLLFASVLTVMCALIDVLTFWRSRFGRFAATARFDAVRAVGTLAAQLALAPLAGLGLVLGTAAGTGVSALLACRDARGAAGGFSLAGMLAAARHHRAYPLFGVPQGWLASASRNILPLLLFKYAGAAVAGQFWLAHRLLLTPVALVNSAYRQAALPLLGRGTAESNRRLCLQHTLALLALGLVPCAVLFLHGEIILANLLGGAWREAGAIAGWLALGFLADGVKIPVTALVQSEKRQPRLLVWEAALAVLRYGGALPLLASGETQAAIAWYAVSGALGWAAFVAGELRPSSGRVSGSLT